MSGEQNASPVISFLSFVDFCSDLYLKHFKFALPVFISEVSLKETFQVLLSLLETSLTKYEYEYKVIQIVKKRHEFLNKKYTPVIMKRNRDAAWEQF